MTDIYKGNGPKERSDEILKQWQEEIARENSDRRDRQLRENDDSEGTEKVKEFRHRYPPNCS